MSNTADPRIQELTTIRNALAHIDDLKARRAELVIELTEEGLMTNTSIAEAAGMTRMDIWRIVQRAQK